MYFQMRFFFVCLDCNVAKQDQITERIFHSGLDWVKGFLDCNSGSLDSRANPCGKSAARLNVIQFLAQNCVQHSSILMIQTSIATKLRVSENIHKNKSHFIFFVCSTEPFSSVTSRTTRVSSILPNRGLNILVLPLAQLPVIS